MIRYVFKDDEPIRIKAAAKADPQAIGSALEEIARTNSGELHPRAVVEAARVEDHPLHQHFEWDDRAAAEAHRMEQARNIIRIIRVEDDTVKEGTTRAFHSINDGGVAYRHVQDVRASPDFQEALMKQADRDLSAFQQRYRSLAEVCEFVVKAREAIARKRVKNETRAAA